MKPKFKTLLHSVIIIFFSISVSKAQTADDPVTAPMATPPNSASFTQYLKVPVGQFTGIPEIKVPLYDINVDKLSIPIYLTYYAHGIQPNTHSGWVGTGWSLVANGTITRKINGIADEFCSDYVMFPPPAGNSQYGWYFGANHNQHYTVNSIVGNTLASTWGPVVQVTDTAPDEFDFSFNGLSGCFFMGSDGTWKVHSANGENIKIQETVGSVAFSPLQHPTSQYNLQTVNPTFLQFVLTTGDGTRYIFGGGATTNTTIDFSRRGPSNEWYNNNLTAVAWHISEIDLPSGKKIFYNYFRNGSQFTYTPYSNITCTNSFNASGYIMNGNSQDRTDFNMGVADPVYLQTIVFPDGKLVFNATPSGENDVLVSGMPYNLIAAENNFAGTPPGVLTAYNIYHTYTDLGNNYFYNSQGNITSIWYELNGIQIQDYLGNQLKYFNLNYTQDANTRLFLSSVQETDYYNSTTTGNALPPYRFYYNNTPLPAYCSLNTDHWGFYNGPKTFPTWALDADLFVTTTFQNQYFQFREPDTTYMQAGMLTQINYPTGGYSQFTFESNRYMKWVGMPIAINPLSTVMYGGGVRIKRVVTTDNVTLTPITYEYSYVNDLTHNVCSGVLGMPKANYAQNDVVSYASYDANGNAVPISGVGVHFGFWSSDTIYPSQNDDGNIVTYTTVIERQSNNGAYNGMTVTTFSNHDNGYANNPPDAVAYSLASAVPQFHYSDRAFERGMVLSEAVYDQNNNLIKAIQNTYNNNANRFNQYVGAILCSLKVEQAGQLVGFGGTASRPLALYIPNNSAVRFYTFYPYLQQNVETDYASDQSGNATTTTTNYSYDQVNGTRNLVSSVTTDSKGQLWSTLNKYPLDYNLTGITPSDVFSNGIKNLQTLSAVSVPVEKTIQVTNADGSNLRTTASMLTSFDSFYPFPKNGYVASIVNPANTFTTSGITPSGTLTKDQTYEPKTFIDQYDGLGNITQMHEAQGINQSFQWGYNGNYLIAAVKNATAFEFYFLNFEDDNTSFYGQGHTGHRYTMNPTVVWAIPDSRNYVIGYWYRASGVWKYSGELSYTPAHTSNVYVMTGGDAYDDIRIYPADAQMTTYTYDPLVGMTSSTDAKGETTFYEYDLALRL